MKTAIAYLVGCASLFAAQAHASRPWTLMEVFHEVCVAPMLEKTGFPKSLLVEHADEQTLSFPEFIKESMQFYRFHEGLVLIVLNETRGDRACFVTHMQEAAGADIGHVESVANILRELGAIRTSTCDYDLPDGDRVHVLYHGDLSKAVRVDMIASPMGRVAQFWAFEDFDISAMNCAGKTNE